jgi:triacylglycerol lipase
MKRLEWALEGHGYRVVNLSYPSTRLSVEDAAALLNKSLSQRIPHDVDKIHFVTHSLGGIILRQYLAKSHLSSLGRVVMFAPPNQGSELADRLRHNSLFRLCTGPAGQQLGTDPSSIPRCLGPVDFELGVIAGDRSLNPLFSAWIPGPDDGKVSVRAAQVDGMRDFMIVHHSHTWMTWRQDAVKAALDFLESGHFLAGTAINSSKDGGRVASGVRRRKSSV